MRFWSDIGANVAISFTLLLPVLTTAVGVAVDYGYLAHQKERLQAAVDAAAVNSARELRVASINDDQVQAIAERTVAAALAQHSSSAKTSVKVIDEPLSVSVTAVQKVDSLFMGLVDAQDVSANAVARILGGTPLCVLGLDDDKKKAAITLEVNARLTGTDCAIYSNSKSKEALLSRDGALLEAGLICTVGGAKGNVSNFSPDPVTDCPKVEDPLADRPAPTIGACTETDLRIGVKDKLKVDEKYIEKLVKDETKDETGKKKKKVKNVETVPEESVNPYETTYVTLYPGVYCGGILIGEGVHATFMPGTYIIKDGPLYVTEYATIKGDHVGFYFNGRQANLYLGPKTTVELTAPTSGAMAGLLVFEDRDSHKLRPYAILSDNARVLEGTLYLPQSHLYIDADAPIADESAYTAIIARRLELYAGPHLVLNTDYDATDVPVPSGIADSNARVLLTN